MSRLRTATCLLAATIAAGCADDPPGTLPPAGASGLRLAVLGDSDSHSYGDRVSFPPGSGRRGGAYREATLQWTEALARMRPGAIDLGPWGPQGTRRAIAVLRAISGLDYRTPAREDFAFNYARSGATCDDLDGWPLGQARQLASRIARAPRAWDGAVVVIRLGINDLGTPEALETFAAPGPADAAMARADGCVAKIAAAVARLEATGARLRFVLVGILDNTDWPRLHGRWQDPAPLGRIRAVLDRFDDGLRRLAHDHPDRAFFDDRAWFAARWGGRDAAGRPAYREATPADGLAISLSEGDDPANAVLADGHAGLAWNAMWAASLLEAIRARWNAGPPPISREEIGSLIRQPGGRPRG